jgi:hypothetical protein
MPYPWPKPVAHTAVSADFRQLSSLRHNAPSSPPEHSPLPSSRPERSGEPGSSGRLPRPQGVPVPPGPRGSRAGAFPTSVIPGRSIPHFRHPGRSTPHSVIPAGAFPTSVIPAGAQRRAGIQRTPAAAPGCPVPPGPRGSRIKSGMTALGASPEDFPLGIPAGAPPIPSSRPEHSPLPSSRPERSGEPGSSGRLPRPQGARFPQAPVDPGSSPG